MKLLPARRVVCACAGVLFAAAAGDVGAGGPHPGRPIASPPRNPLQIAVVPAPPPPTAAELAAFAGPNPAGLQSQFPAGLPQPGQPVPPAFGMVGRPVDGFGRWGGATAAGYGGIAVGAADTLPVYAGNGHPGPYSAVEIAKSFIEADTNRDGSLTPAEAQRLAIMPKTFEGMDTNHDGIVTRWEYEDAFR